MPMDEKSRQYTAFMTPSNQYEFLKIPFGLSIAPGVFQKFINAVFRGFIAEKVTLAYMDDLIVLAKDHEEAMKNPKRVIDVSGDHGLCINWKKCKFLQRSSI